MDLETLVNCGDGILRIGLDSALAAQIVARKVQRGTETKRVG